jgi:hypothetical protein
MSTELSRELLNECIDDIEHTQSNEYYYDGYIKQNNKLNPKYFICITCDKDLTKTKLEECCKVKLVGMGDSNAFYYKSQFGKELLILQSMYDLYDFKVFEFPHYKFGK